MIRAIRTALLVPSVCCLFIQGCGSSGGDDTSDAGGISGRGAAGGAPSSSGGQFGVQLGGSTSSDAGSMNGEAGEGGGRCGGEAVNAKPRDVNLLFVIDRSESMQTIPEGFSAPKWEAMVTALKATLGAVRGKMGVGLQFFPDPAEGSAEVGCGMPLEGELTIPIDASELTVPLIERKLDDSLPTGSTPTADALALAHAYFTAGAGAQLVGEKFVLLALDGGPNCNDTLACGQDTPAARALCTQTYDKPQSCGASAPFNCCNAQPQGCLDDVRVVEQVVQLRRAGIITLVVGIPGSEPYADVLDALAEAGGVAAGASSPRYFKVEDPDSLTETLGALAFDLIRSCELQLATEPPDPTQVNVYVDGEVVPQAGDDGWELSSSTIRLKGTTCAHVEEDGAQRISVEFGCPTIVIPR
ncbi:MAG TPA: hypothetical protein VER33_04915 [Polyangiaceae bacterium]|nr:hypothetical protein [Polyangiaceae bacterium]